MIPIIATVPNPRLVPGRQSTIFNPLYSFDQAIPIHEMHYRFTFGGRSGPQQVEASWRT